MCRFRCRGRRGERGATATEYVLFVAIFALVATAAVTGLNGTARAYFTRSADRVGRPVNQVVDGNALRVIAETTTTITAVPTPDLPPTTVPVTSGPRVVWAVAGEGGALTLAAPEGEVFIRVLFASYGTPSSGYPYQLGGCHAASSVAEVSKAFLGTNAATLGANNHVFGEPCAGQWKTLAVALEY